MKRKEILFTITKAFCNRYHLNDSFVGLNIVIYPDRYLHIDKHRDEYIYSETYEYIKSNLNKLVSSPDFVVVNNKNQSMNFVKKLSENVLIAISINVKKELRVKTVFPISNIRYQAIKNKSL